MNTIVCSSATKLANHPDVEKGICSECQAEIWVSYSSKKVSQEEPDQWGFVCENCALKKMQENPEELSVMLPNADQIKEISKQLGIPEEIIKQKVETLVTNLNLSSKFKQN